MSDQFIKVTDEALAVFRNHETMMLCYSLIKSFTDDGKYLSMSTRDLALKLWKTQHNVTTALKQLRDDKYIEDISKNKRPRYVSTGKAEKEFSELKQKRDADLKKKETKKQRAPENKEVDLVGNLMTQQQQGEKIA